MAEQSSDREYLQFVDERIKWYKRTADRTMVQFIAIRFGLVLVSAALPALTLLEHRTWAIGASVLIAALTGLDTQFQWGDEWRHFRSTQLALERARRHYDLAVADASRGPSRLRARTGQASFSSFYEEVERLLERDAEQFFKFRIRPWKRGATG
jgi:hypothetical protein